MDISTALFLERARILEQWDVVIMDKKVEGVKMVYHIPIITTLNAS